MSTRLVLPTEGSHFYTPDGAPLYEVEMKSNAGKFRRANLGDAKKAGAWPSVTTINRMWAAPQLEAWKINNAILAAITLPRIAGESDDAFAKRVAEDAVKPSSEAADLGSTVHRAIEIYVSGKGLPDDNMAKYVNPVAEWIKSEGIKFTEFESIHVNREMKYGCRVDAIGGDNYGKFVLVDWKTQRGYKGKMTAYDEHGQQIIANGAAVSGIVIDRLIDVYVSTADVDSNGTAVIMVKEWSEEELATAWEMFRMARRAYEIKNGI
jgi:hypothetical protein